MFGTTSTLPNSPNFSPTSYPRTFATHGQIGFDVTG